MGLLRLWLAMNVVASHAHVSRPWLFDGIMSVQGFYVISGFYMALVLDTKYQNRIREFYIARFLRIWPAYAVALVGTLFLYWAFSLYLGVWVGWLDRIHALPHAPNFWAWCGMALSQLSLVGTDLYFFLGVNPLDGSLYPSASVWSEPINAVHLLVLQQSWSLSIELVFYALAPFLVRLNNRRLYFLVVAGILLRISLVSDGLAEDPWCNRFLPLELTVFCAGILAYRYWRDHKPGGQSFFPIALALLAVCAQDAGLSSLSLRIGFFVAIAFALPQIFAHFADDPIDRWLGELSYPLYLVHFTILHLGLALVPRGLWPRSFDVTLLICLVAAWLFWKLVDARIEGYRKRFSASER